MFGKKSEFQNSDFKAQNGRETKDQIPVLGANQVVSAPSKPTVVREKSAAPARPSLVRDAAAPRPSLVREDGALVSREPSIIREGFEFVGDMKAAGSLTVDGAIKGNLSVHELLIGTTGLVDGSVTADSIHVEGTLSGAVDCKDLTIGSRAVVDGNLSYRTIAIQKGGTVKGDLKRT